MLGSFEKAAKNIVFKPAILIPMLVVGLFVLVSEMLTNWVIERPLIDMFLYANEIPTSNLLQVMIANYPLEIVTMIIGGIIMLFVSIVAFLSIAKFASGKGVVESINDCVMEWKKSLALTVFALIAGFVALVLVFIIAWIFESLLLIMGTNMLSEFFGVILFPLIYIVIFIIFITKLSFVLPAMNKDNPRQAVQKSWEFTNEQFGNALAFIIVNVIITYAIILIFSFISFWLEDVDFIIKIIGEAIAVTFFILAISYYYFK
jgi:hypothetical protein